MKKEIKIIDQSKLMQKEVLKNYNDEKRKHVVNFRNFKELNFKIMVGKRGLKAERDRLSRLIRDETNE